MATQDPLKQVILCRGITEKNSTHNEYMETFKSAGYSCYHLPTLRFEFVNLSKLKNCLLSPDRYGGLILTSRRAVEAISHALQGESLPEQWNNLPVYCVGPATKSHAETELKLQNCTGFHCGDANQLANYIADNAPKGNLDANNLLYPCSAIARDTIQRTLKDTQISLEKVVVYETLPTKTLETDLKLVLSECVQILVFFSPSAVEFILNIVCEQSDLLKNIQAVAIGPASAETLLKAGVPVGAISTKPEPQALLQAIQLAGL